MCTVLPCLEMEKWWLQEEGTRNSAAGLFAFGMWHQVSMSRGITRGKVAVAAARALVCTAPFW